MQSTVALQPAGAIIQHFCGHSCTNQSPTAVVTLLDGTRARCSDSARTVWGPQGPWASTGESQPGLYDGNMLVSHVYSRVCQTTWLSAHNYKAIGRTYCSMWETNTAISPHPTSARPCPAAGTTATTGMVEDHSNQSYRINYGHLEEITYRYGPLLEVDTDLY